MVWLYLIRNDKGAVILTASGVIHNAMSAEEVEVTVCREGVRMALRWSPKPTILESDCMTAINLLLKPHVVSYGATDSQSVLSRYLPRRLSFKVQCRDLPSIVFKHVK
jgi:hypothetical protein